MGCMAESDVRRKLERDRSTASARPLLQLAPLILGAALENSELGLLASLFPSMQASLGLPVAALGVVFAAEKLAGVMVSPFWIGAANRYGYRGVLVAAAWSAGLVTIATGFAS